MGQEKTPASVPSVMGVGWGGGGGGNTGGGGWNLKRHKQARHHGLRGQPGRSSQKSASCSRSKTIPGTPGPGEYSRIRAASRSGPRASDHRSDPVPSKMPLSPAESTVSELLSPRERLTSKPSAELLSRMHPRPQLVLGKQAWGHRTGGL